MNNSPSLSVTPLHVIPWFFNLIGCQSWHSDVTAWLSISLAADHMVKSIPLPVLHHLVKQRSKILNKISNSSIIQTQKEYKYRADQGQASHLDHSSPRRNISIEESSINRNVDSGLGCKVVAWFLEKESWSVVWFCQTHWESSKILFRKGNKSSTSIYQ